MSGKGDKRRPSSVNEEEIGESWKRIFRQGGEKPRPCASERVGYTRCKGECVNPAECSDGR